MRRSGVYIVNEPADDPPSTENGGPDHVYLNKMTEEGENGMGEEMMNDTVGLPVEASTPTPKKSKRIRLPSVYRSSLVKLLCGLYALIIVVLGIVFSTATSLTAKERHHQFYLEVFLVYLYVFSLGLLIYFQLGLLSGIKVKNNYYEPNIRISVRNDGSIHKSPTASPYPTRAADSGANRSEEVQPLDQSKAEQVSVGSYHSHMELPSPGGVAHAGEGINFYLRLGALAFACGSVILDGFHIATYFETQMTEECKSPIFIFVYVMHLFFTFVQTFFLFKNHKLVIDKAKPLVRFGMMHLMATNLCVVIVTAVTETAEDYRHDYFNNLLKYQALNNITPKDNVTGSCYRQETLARSASPYLFPSLIIYSIIAAGIIYRLYQYIGVRIKQRWPSHTSLTSSVPAGAAAIDCEKANKGLFLGLLVAVLTLIAMAIFFVFYTRVESPDNAIKVFFTTEIILMVITSVGIVWGYMRLSILKFLKTIFFSVDSVLLLVALAGSYIYLCFTLISVFSFCSEMGTDTIKGILSLVTIALAICQITLQTVFILDGLCRCAENDEQMMAKPGRAVVTFLLICNLAMWIVSMFEMKKTKVVEIHENFYGILAWNIINHLCVPLLIFFRFHSAICLSKIWYNAYQKEKVP